MFILVNQLLIGFPFCRLAFNLKFQISSLGPWLRLPAPLYCFTKTVRWRHVRDLHHIQILLSCKQTFRYGSSSALLYLNQLANTFVTVDVCMPYARHVL